MGIQKTTVILSSALWSLYRLHVYNFIKFWSSPKKKDSTKDLSLIKGIFPKVRKE